MYKKIQALLFFFFACHQFQVTVHDMYSRHRDNFHVTKCLNETDQVWCGQSRILYINSPNIAFGDSLVCTLCLVPIDKAYGKHESSNSCCARSHSAVVVLLSVASHSVHQMHKVNHEEMMFSSWDIFLMLMQEKIWKKCSQVPNLEYESSLKSFEGESQVKSEVTECPT